MPKLSESIFMKPITALIWGHSGSGKTSLWGLMAKHEEFCPIYCLDFDLRLDSLKVTLTPEEMSQIYFDPFRDGKYQGESALEAMKIAKSPDSVDKKYGVNFKTIVADSGTFLMASFMARCLFLHGGKEATSTPLLPEYMSQMSMTTEFVSKLCDSKRNFIFTCHEKNLKDEVLGKVHKAVDMTGDKTPDRIPGFFNELWHCEVAQRAGEENRFTVRTKSDQIYSARTTFKTLNQMEDQGKLWPKIIAERTNENTKIG